MIYLTQDEGEGIKIITRKKFNNIEKLERIKYGRNCLNLLGFKQFQIVSISVWNCLNPNRFKQFPYIFAIFDSFQLFESNMAETVSICLDSWNFSRVFLLFSQHLWTYDWAANNSVVCSFHFRAGASSYRTDQTSRPGPAGSCLHCKYRKWKEK